MLEVLAAIFDWIGVVAFAATGAIVASRKQMDLVGFALLGTATGVGGGTIRDLILGVPVFWAVRPAYLLVCVSVSVLVFFTAHLAQSRYRLLLWFDAIGLAGFATAGADKALAAGADPLIAVTMGVITATFGGILRDLLATEAPVLLSREIYATAALLGASVLVGALLLGVPREIALGGGFLVAFSIRTVALLRGWALPRYRPRAGGTLRDRWPDT